MNSIKRFHKDTNPILNPCVLVLDSPAHWYIQRVNTSFLLFALMLMNELGSLFSFLITIIIWCLLDLNWFLCCCFTVSVRFLGLSWLGLFYGLVGTEFFQKLCACSYVSFLLKVFWTTEVLWFTPIPKGEWAYVCKLSGEIVPVTQHWCQKNPGHLPVLIQQAFPPGRGKTGVWKARGGKVSPAEIGIWTVCQMQ